MSINSIIFLIDKTLTDKNKYFFLILNENKLATNFYFCINPRIYLQLMVLK